MLKIQITRLITLVGFLLCAAIAQGQTAGADISGSLKEARAMCSGLSPENKRMARAAGYDIGKLCKSLEGLSGLPSTAANEDLPVVLPRGETLESIAEPDADADMMPAEEESLELKPFGYDLFAGEPTSFQPATRIPVSPNYQIGPGDTLQILFFGKTNETHSLEVNRDGSVDFPELGPISLAGLTFSEAKELLLKRISEQMIGVQASISLGELRSIQVFVLGEAYKPGAYTVSALSTITNALFVSGGVSDIASLRNIQLKRAGKVVATLDLYDLLLRGDTSGDVRLQSGDAIYVPTVGNTASVDGEVRRPAIYELKSENSAAELLALAGGLQPKAYPNASRIHRVDGNGFMTVVDVDLTQKAGRDAKVINGDLLFVDSVVDRKQNVVTLSGHVYRPGEFRWRQGMTVTDVVRSVSQLKDGADLDFAIIQRELPPNGLLEVQYVDLRTALADKKGASDIAFYPRDELMIFSNLNGRLAEGADNEAESGVDQNLNNITAKGQENQDLDGTNLQQIDDRGRVEILAELVERLKLQARSGELAQVVSINGTVRYPGEYPLTKGMTVTQLVAAAGGMSEAAYTQRVELSRFDFSDAERAGSNHQVIDLQAAYQGGAADMQLSSYDVLSVRTIPEFKENLSITLEGEVRFPGVYAFKRGEHLSDVIKRAGGLTELAHGKAAVFTREDLRSEEEKRLKELQARLKADLAIAELEQANEGEKADIGEAEKLLKALDTSEAIGRLVIDLPAIIAGQLDDVVLKDGDQLVIPEYRQEVSVIGEVQHPTSHLYNEEFDLQEYIERSGGTNLRADDKRIYVVKADGSVALPGRSGWLSRRGLNLEPGDTVIVPLDVDRMKTLTVWGEASRIVYQLALGAAAINSF